MLFLGIFLGAEGLDFIDISAQPAGKYFNKNNVFSLKYPQKIPPVFFSGARKVFKRGKIRYRVEPGSYFTLFEHKGEIVPVLLLGSMDVVGPLFAGAYYFEGTGGYFVSVAPTYRVSLVKTDLRKLVYYYGACSGKVRGRGIILHWMGVLPADWIHPRKWLRKESERFMAERVLFLSKLLEYSEFLKIHRENSLVPYMSASLYIYSELLADKGFIDTPLEKSLVKKIKSNAMYVLKKINVLEKFGTK